MIHLAARGIRAVWEPDCGHLPSLVIGGAPVLHAVPWRDDPDIQSDEAIPMVDRRLGGTFACAPFGKDDVDGGPPHGLSANAPWRQQRVSPSSLHAVRRLARGRIEARITLRDDHPVLYQTHILDLDAPCTFAHHPMIRLAEGGRLSTRELARLLTFDAAEAPIFAPGQDNTAPLGVDGQPRDWRDYPSETCEDFAALLHPPGLTWTAIARQAEDDTIVTLKRAEQLPLTCLWISNGAREGVPWHGQRGVLGIEDARCSGADGFAAALSGKTHVPAPTAFPTGRHVIPHAVLRLEGRHEIAGLTPGDGTLALETATDPITIPFDMGHFA